MYTIEWRDFRGQYILGGDASSILSLAGKLEVLGFEYTVALHGKLLSPKDLNIEGFTHWLVANEVQPPNTIRIHVTNAYHPEENRWVFVPEVTPEELEVMKDSRIKFVKMYRERCHTSLKVAVKVAEYYNGNQA